MVCFRAFAAFFLRLLPIFRLDKTCRLIPLLLFFAYEVNDGFNSHLA
jgi:hypothetical protein